MIRGTIRHLAAATVVAVGTLGVGLGAGMPGASAHSALSSGLSSGKRQHGIELCGEHLCRIPLVTLYAGRHLYFEITPYKLLK
jgi:hypothetical protein